MGWETRRHEQVNLLASAHASFRSP